jgi:ABC-2 type transport system permease protein
MTPIAFSKLRPFNAATIVKLAVTAAVGAAFLYGDLVLFRRLFAAVAEVEKATPFFALGLLRSLIALVFLIAVTILFSSSMTAAIGAFFADLDLDTYHAAPMPKTTLVLERWFKTFAQSATIVYIFIVPMFVAFAQRYRAPASFYPVVLINLALLLAIPVTLGALVILVLVRTFPVAHVHQVVTTLAMLVLVVFVLALRLSRPERLFTDVNTDELRAVLRAVQLPSIERYPGTALAD